MSIVFAVLSILSALLSGFNVIVGSLLVMMIIPLGRVVCAFSIIVNIVPVSVLFAMAVTLLVISSSLPVIKTSVVIISVGCGCKLIAQAIVLLLSILTGLLTLLGFMPSCTVAALVLVLPHLKFL